MDVRETGALQLELLPAQLAVAGARDDVSMLARHNRPRIGAMKTGDCHKNTSCTSGLREICVDQFCSVLHCWGACATDARMTC